MQYIKYTPNLNKTSKPNDETALFSEENVKKIYKFHKSMKSAYNQTPLIELSALAQSLGISSFYVKDESKRGNLKAFKLLGGAYAVAKSICKKLNVNIDDIDFDYLKSNKVKKQLGNLVFAAASDGNHGKSVAWAANEFNQTSIVYMPKGTAQDRIEAIENLGGTVVVSDHNYDWCVNEVTRLADEKNWNVVLDTASDGDTQTAKWVMQGYSTMGLEIIRQLGKNIITHIFLQAGVGSMAASMIAIFANHFKQNCPKMYIMEPHNAACFFESGKNSDGNPHSVAGEMDSIMAGLSCGVPSPVAWEIIRNFADGFLSSDDLLSANGMRILANPLGDDQKIISGESGAIGTGIIDHILKNQPAMAKELGLDENSKILVFSTEGDTDTKNYRDVVWYGKHSY